MSEESRDERIEAALQNAAGRDSGISDGLRRRVQDVISAFRRLEPQPDWLGDVAPLGEFEARLTGITTRATGAQVMTEAIDADLPQDFDPQVNVDANGVTIHVEVAVERERGELWAAVQLDDALIGTPLTASLADPRLREATLPYAGTGAVRIRIVQAPKPLN